MKTSRFILAALSLARLAALTAADITLTRDGQPRAAIVVARGTLQSGSVKVLVEHVKQMSGAALPVLTEAELHDARIEGGKVIAPDGKIAAENFILLGESELTRRLGLSTDGISSGGIVLKTSGNTVALLGRDDGSSGKRKDFTSHAVFNFLEALGCRSLWPGETGKVVPKKRTITVANLDVRFTPPIGQRNIRFTDG